MGKTGGGGVGRLGGNLVMNIGYGCGSQVMTNNYYNLLLIVICCNFFAFIVVVVVVVAREGLVWYI